MTTSTLGIIGRQPIINGQQAIIAYEFFVHHDADTAAPDAAGQRDLHTCATLLSTAIDDMQDNWLLGQQSAFINVDHNMLMSPLIELMPADKTVLKLLASSELSPELLARCKDLKARHYQIALDQPHEINPAHAQALAQLLPLVDYLKCDLNGMDQTQIQAWLKQYQRANTQVIAAQVEQPAQFNTLKSLGLSLFQGSFYAKPDIVVSKVINPSFDGVLHLLDLVSRDAENHAIENGFKRDTTLSYKLLRYINSVGFGLSCEVKSINHALTILGRNQLYRWLTLLMVTAGNNTTSPALMKTSIIRGRLTELLGTPYFGKQDCDNLFIVGVFSMLDVILKMPMAQVIEKLSLPEAVVEALLHRSGVFGPFLKLTEASENVNTPDIVALAHLLHLEPAHVNQCHIEALAWTEALGI